MPGQPLLKYNDYLILIGRCEEEKYLLAVENEQLRYQIEELKKEVARLIKSNGKLESTHNN